MSPSLPPLFLPIVRQLAHTHFLSGAAIAEKTGCSRTTVHNVLRQAGEFGIAVHAVHGRGYRLAQTLSWLDAARITAELAARGMVAHCFETLPSSNAWLLEEAQSGAAHRSLAVVEWQTQGRGRRGRTWLGGLGRSLAFSLLWRSSQPVAGLSGLSLAVGVVLVETLRALGVTGAHVKWPNDILVADEKLAGILIELSGDMLGPSAAVIGIGINVDGSAGLRNELPQPVTDLATHLAGPVARTDLLLQLVRALDDGLALFEQHGFSAFQARWHACHAHQDKAVRILFASGETVEGVATGVDASGALLVKTARGLQSFHSGEVSLRSVTT